jgi:hypothetical protein
MARRVAKRLPFKLGLKMGLATLLRPRTRGWARARDAINEYVGEQEARQRKALRIEDQA